MADVSYDRWELYYTRADDGIWITDGTARICLGFDATVRDAIAAVAAGSERERVTALWREAVAALEEPSLVEIQSRAEAVLDVAASRAKIADAMGTLHVLQSRADRILNGHDDPSEMAHDIRRLRQEAHGHLVAARAALGEADG
jgi:hypothetical protein